MPRRAWLSALILSALAGVACSEEPGGQGAVDGGGTTTSSTADAATTSPDDDAGTAQPRDDAATTDDASTTPPSDAAATTDDASASDDASTDASIPRVDGGTFPVVPGAVTVALGEQVELTLDAPQGSAPLWAVDGTPLGSAELGALAPQADPRVVVFTAPEDPRVLPPVSRTVTASLGAASGEAVVSLAYPAPTLASLMPTAIDVGSSTTSIFVTGTGFSRGTQADIDGVPARVQYLSPTRLDVDAPSARLRITGMARLRITNPAPGGGSVTGTFAVVLHQAVVPPGADPAIVGLFGAAGVGVDAARRPAITYPEAGSVGPRDFAAPVVSWSQPAPLNVCRLRMTGPTAVLDVFTSTAARPAFERPQATVPASVWIPVIQGAPRPTVFEVQVSCAQAQRPAGQPLRLVGNVIHESTSRPYTVAGESATGRIVYFSGSIQGLARIDIRPDVAPPEAWVGPGANFRFTTASCVGCHSFSQSGTRMAHVAIDPSQANLGALDINGIQPSLRFQQMNSGVAEWVAMHPSGNTILAQNAAATLNLHDSNGVFVRQVPTTTAARFMTQPAWAGDGSAIAFTGTNQPQTYGNESVQAGSIYVMSYSNAGGAHTFGPARRVAAPAAMGGNAYYPSFSPDGRWIVFCRAGGGESYNNPDGRLWLVSADGRVGPILLSRASQTVPGNTNSWPRWSPITADGRYYLMFSSVRAYPPLDGAGPQQLWVTQIDTNQLPGDPSSPAIWMSGQDPFTINLAAEWTQAF